MKYLAVLFLCVLHAAVVVCDISCLAGDMYVTCNFNRDIRAERMDFIVFRFPFGTTQFSGKNGKQVLACNWAGQDTPSNCRLEPGYTFDYKVRGGLLSVDMANVSRMYEGIYMCQLVNGGSIPFTTCNITVNDAESDDKSTSPSAGTSQSLGTTECDNTALIVVSFVLSVFVVVVVVVLLFVFYRLNYRIERRTSGDSACCGLTVRKVTRQQVNPPDATDEESTPLNTVNTESEGNQGDGKNSRPLPPIPVAASQGGKLVSSTNKQESVTDIDTSINHPLASVEASTKTDLLANTSSGPLWMVPPLKEDESDKWTADQVCEWLKQEGLGMHLKSFEHKVNGQRLLSFSYEAGLNWYLNMGDGPDGKDRERLIAKIERLRRQVAARQEREEQERKEREKKECEERERKKPKK